MLLSDVTFIQKINSQKPNTVATDSSKISTVDQYEVELDRLYCTSPIITEWSATFSLGELYKAESEEGFNQTVENGRTITPISFMKDKSNKPITFSPVEIKPLPKPLEGENSFKPSELTRLIQLNEGSFGSARNKGKMRLTIYLPDFSDMQVYAAVDCTIGELIRIILTQHEHEDLDPALDYRNPSLYELRMHEGDGEPDRDFPAYNMEQLLRNIESDEFCLCEVEDNPSYRTYSIGESLFATPPPITMSDKSSTSDTSSHKMRDPSGLLPPTPYSEDLETPPKTIPLMDNSVTIRFPDGRTLNVDHEEDATLSDLLPTIAKSFRLRLYTDEYEFYISPQDQKLLSLASPIVDMNTHIYAIGTRVFEIHKKTYADAGKLMRNNNQQNRSSRRQDQSYPLGNNNNNNFPNFANGANEDGNITFTEATANAYQQWNVVKKNKFGIKQERIFGVDGKKVYNAKRGQLRAGNSSVQRAEREISSIVKIEKLPNDNKTFRITWMDNGDIYYIEYTCETTRECSEIVAKIKFLLNRNSRSKSNA